MVNKKDNRVINDFSMNSEVSQGKTKKKIIYQSLLVGGANFDCGFELNVDK